MASSLRILKVGILWIVTMVTLGYLTYMGGMWMKVMNDFIMSFYLNSSTAAEVGGIWWFESLYYITILLVAIAATYRCYQEVAVVTDYYPEMGMM